MKSKLLESILPFIIRLISKAAMQELKDSKHCLIWKGNLRIVPVKKAMIYNLALDRGLVFEKWADFEAWYQGVDESSFPIEANLAEKHYYHQSINGERINLMWTK